MTSSDDDFDWKSDDSIAVREQPAVAVYCNLYGGVTLRRERAWNEEDDCIIPIAKENVLAIIGAILRAAGMENVRLYRENGMACYDIDLPEAPQPAAEPKVEVAPSRDPTASERQRRRRAKQRDSHRDTCRDDRDTCRDDRDSGRDNVTEPDLLRIVHSEKSEASNG
jgi:hypothetical protein